MSTINATELAQSQQALTEAARTARFAPSIHNTQPWRWTIRPGALELWAAAGRQLPVTDPDGRMATLSCGAALHHVRIALAAQGRRVTMLPLPDPDHPDHLADVRIRGQWPVNTAATRLFQAIERRHTDRRPPPDRPLDERVLLAITLAVQAEGCHLHVLRRDQVIELAGAAGYAQRTEIRDEAVRAELENWAGGSRPSGTGVPAANIPAAPPQTTVPGRDFGRPGTRDIGDEHDNNATYVLLYGSQDAPPGWLRAGQALSAGWLCATELGATVLPYSAVVEVPATRQRLREMLVEGCYPYLVLRLGNADPDHPGPRPTPRLSSTQTVQTSEN
jgi:nitroreductase